MSKTWEVFIGKDGRLWPKGYGRVEAKSEVFTVSSPDKNELQDTFIIGLEKLINSRSMDNLCNTPDYMLAEFIIKIIDAYKTTNEQRDHWHKGKVLQNNEVFVPMPRR